MPAAAYRDEDGFYLPDNADPRYWQHAGNHITLTGSVNNFRAKAGRVNLPSPTMIAVQIGRDPDLASIADGTEIDIFATIEWQVGRGTQKADVDVGRGTYVTLASAQAVDVNITAQFYGDSGGGTAITSSGTIGSLVCTIAPCTAPNPNPATRTQHFSLGAGATFSPVVPPNFAKRARFIVSNTTGSPDPLPNFQLRWRTGLLTSGDARAIENLAHDYAMPILPGCDSYEVFNGNASAHDLWIVWELAL